METVDLQFDVAKQVLTRKDDLKLASGAVNSIVAKFDFTSEWDGLYAFCRFEGSNGIKDVRIENNECVVPWEMIVEPGFKMSVYGTQATNVMLTTRTIYLNVYHGVNFVRDKPLPQTLSLLDQYEKVIEKSVAEQQANNEMQESNNARTDEMVNVITSAVIDDVRPTVESAQQATHNANAAAERANNAITDLESGVIPIIENDQIEEIFFNL